MIRTDSEGENVVAAKPQNQRQAHVKELLAGAAHDEAPLFCEKGSKFTSGPPVFVRSSFTVRRVIKLVSGESDTPIRISAK